MFSALKKLFCPYEEVAAEIEQDVREPAKNISEPVLTIVQSVVNNPRKWKCWSTYSKYMTEEGFLLDKERDILFSISRSGRYYRTGTNTEWMTQDEITYAVNTLQPIFSARHDRYYKLLAIRSNRRLVKQRQNFMNIYLEGA